MAKAKANKLPTTSLANDVPLSRTYKPSAEDEARERRYKAEEGLRTLQRAEECKKDKGLMKDIKSLVKEQAKAVAKA